MQNISKIGRILDTKIFYFVAENLVLWARSETIGYAMNPAASGSGMMEYWNDGMLKTRV
jgi:hypothetical protein